MGDTTTDTMVSHTDTTDTMDSHTHTMDPMVSHTHHTATDTQPTGTTASTNVTHTMVTTVTPTVTPTMVTVTVTVTVTVMVTAMDTLMVTVMGMDTIKYQDLVRNRLKPICSDVSAMEMWKINIFSLIMFNFFSFNLI